MVLPAPSPALPLLSLCAASLVEANAAMSLASQLWFGGAGPRWSLIRVQALLGRSRRALARCKPWLPSADWHSSQRKVATLEAQAHALAAASRGAPADSLPAVSSAGARIMHSPFTAVHACAACGKVTGDVKFCAACKRVAYW